MEGRVLRGKTASTLAAAVRAALRHGRGQQHLLPLAAEVVGRVMGRADPAELRLLAEGEPVPDSHQETHRSRRRDPALLRTAGTARPVSEAGTGAVAATGDISPERRAARGPTRSLPARKAHLRVPASELVRPPFVQAPACAQRPTPARVPPG